VFKVIKVDGPNLVTDKGCVCLAPFQYADGGKSRPVGTEDWRAMRALFLGAPRLLEAAKALHAVLTAIRLEQVSAGLGFGGTPDERRQSPDQYAAEIGRQAAKVDDALESLGVAVAAAETVV
jgi:hypothetical protein